MLYGLQISNQVVRQRVRLVCRFVLGCALLMFAARGWGANNLGPGPASKAKPTPESKRIAAEFGIGSWIWTTNFADKQLCHLWRGFSLPATNLVQRATLRITADNLYWLYLDGREIGEGANWKNLTEYDLTRLLTPGTHALAVEALNDNFEAGVICGLQIEFANGGRQEILSDSSWRVVPLEVRGWRKKMRPARDWPIAAEVGVPGQSPWWFRPSDVMRLPAVRPVELRFWQSGWFQITLVSILVVGMAAYLRLAAKLAVQSKAQELLQRERARIARDIHDDVGAGLTQLVLQGEVAQTEFPAGSEARVKFDELSERARTVSRALEEVVWVVNSKRDTLRDFSSYVCKYAQLFLRDTTIRCRLDVESNLPEVGLNLSVRRGLLLAVKEALNNAAKYSQATEVYVRVHRRGDALLVEIEDNGVGFDLSLVGSEGNGLANMQERLTEIGGECRIATELGAGCRVEFDAPLQAARKGWRARLWPFRRAAKNELGEAALSGEDASQPS
jgi:signal transduction histidine kinase